MDGGDRRKQVVAGETIRQGKKRFASTIRGVKCKTTMEDKGAGGCMNAKWQVLSLRPSDGDPVLQI
jgi:hypothetical protein